MKETSTAGKKNHTKSVELSIQRPYLDTALIGSQGAPEPFVCDDLCC